ncbi:MAG: HupE/UreJ family protein [Rhodospirillales bacterium]|nr:HupE/UreJ family protein [Rhodospirillales bacterium]
MTVSRLAPIAAFAVSALAAPAFAHTPEGSLAGGFAHGFAHPFGGLDHLLAMGAIGLWAARLGGRAAWGVPLAFLAVMALSGLAGMSGIVPPGIAGIETGAAASVAALGVLIALGVRLPVSAASALAALFAVAHGLAHGAEMPQAGPFALAAGFVAASAALHALGFALAKAAEQIGEKSAHAFRAGGSALAAAGALLLVL